MQNFRVIFSNFAQNDPRLSGMYRQLSGRPSWVWKAALGAAALVIVIPAALIMLAAVFAFVVVFAVATIALRVSAGLDRLFGPRPRRDEMVAPEDAAPGGRRNVRVIYPDQR